MDIFQVFVTMFSKSTAADLLYVGKGQNPFLTFETSEVNDFSKQEGKSIDFHSKS